MNTIRLAVARGRTSMGWLDSYHSFSFGQYHDPAHMGFSDLRVINEDFVEAGQGFGMHGHRDMEIITYVLSGVLEHKDSLGNGSIIKPGEAQMMSAGKGILHSEFNPSETERTHFLQIWILPDEKGGQPRYQQSAIDQDAMARGWVVLASNTGEGLDIRQNARVLATKMQTGDIRDMTVAADRKSWVQIARGNVAIDGQKLGAGDGYAIKTQGVLSIAAESPAEILWFDLNE